ncbi:zinc finger ZZ-type and EF-hand domain-containing protein 1 isoform X2 [Ictalurus furcatus]|uniref:zinc finger ZZ-type and EF-hand domain-containing protein 1 isoform X2 n=1 Tax=Ictalurus furcatus TaxID=66913 RepID=UPI002350A8B7|nr:zinc finger ZZ-type and EF-hand domain-containing protein 1 isoform X2 [Ictalurus furcatus]
MGNAESGGTGSGDEEDIEAESPSFTEGGPASAVATGTQTGGGGGSGSAAGGTGTGRSGRGSTHAPVASSGLPSPEALMEQVRLREAAGRAGDTTTLTVSESAIARNESALVRWLEERLGRGEEALTLEQFCDMLESRDAQRDECEEAFGQFDAEGDGVVDVESMLMALKNSNGANLQGELSHVIRQLQACSLTPGFVDIFSKSKDKIGAHASKILKFLHRNRIPSSAIPFPILDGYNSISSMRAAVLQDFLDYLLQKEKDLDIQYGTELTQGPEVDRVKVVSQCYSSIEASSNSADVHRMTNGETVSYWQSDGSARSHWIRLKLKPDVVLRRLAIAVASSDHSYMPQLVSVSVGKSRRSLQEIRDIRIPSNVTGYVPLLDNANISQPYVQINIKRCLSDGCDTRIHGLKTMGYQVTKSKEVSVSDASAIWYLSLLTSLVTASMETNPTLANTVLQSTQKALQHMPPLSLTPSSTEFPKFFSPNILEEVDAFLLRIADCCVTPDAELTLLAFALARGSVMKVLLSLAGMCERVDSEYRAASLLASMASVRLHLLYRNGKTLQLHLQACDVKSRDDKCGPENMLTDPSTGDGFLTESGKTRASVILSTEDQTCFQVTQIRIKVRKGAIGAKCGLVFTYNDSDVFDADKHFKKFRKYDSWDFNDYKEFVQDKHSNKGGADVREENPVGWFELEDDWNDVEIKLQQCRVANFLMVKFLCVRQDSAERLGVQQLDFSGYVCPDSEKLEEEEQLNTRTQGADCGLVTGLTLIRKTLYFIQQLTRDMDMMLHKQKSLLDFSELNLPLFWDFYRKLRSIDGEEAMKAQVLLLQLLQNCFPALPALPESRGSPENTVSSSSSSSSSSTSSSSAAAAAASVRTDVDPSEAVGALYSHLCQVVDGPEGESAVEKARRKQAMKAILSGAAIFYPDKQSRRDKLFDMMKNLTEEDQPESAKLTFESLCNYFSDQDPSGLLLLPPKGAPADFDISPILNVMDTLLLVATRECERMMVDGSGGPSRKVLLSLFWALQGSLLSWCFLQLKGGVATAGDLARDILIKYVAQFLANTRTTLSSLLERYSATDIIAKLGNSIVTMATRQLAIFLLELCALDVPHCIILKSFFSLLELLKKLSSGVEESSKGDVDGWQHPQQPVVLKTWAMESPHNYEDSKHENTVFLCPGATYFEVEFDERCETEKRYDYLEFTDSRGGKVRYDMKVGSEKWPKKVTFKAGHQLQFLFHSDSSNTEWGYKFTVTAFGLPDISVSWISDLQLLVSRLMGRLASRTMALKSTPKVHIVKELPAAVMNHVISSPLWKPVFMHGLSGPAISREPEHRSNDTKQIKSVSSGDDLLEFLVDFARWDPSRESCDERVELMRNLMLSCKKQLIRNEIAVGSKVDQAVNAIWAAMVYHTPALQTLLRNFVLKQGQSCVSEDLVQVYMLADGIRTWMLEMKQRSLLVKMNGSGEKGDGQGDVTPESLAEICISKSLLLFRFSPCAGSAAAPPPYPEPCKPAESPIIPALPHSVSISEGDFQPCPAPSSSSIFSQSPTRVEAQISASSEPRASSSASAQGSRGSTESLHSQGGEPMSPLTFSRRAPFSCGRLRLLSYRSVEETRPTPSVKERFPVLKHVFSFMKDVVISESSVLQTLALKKSQATSVCEVLDMVQQCLLSLGKPHLFQAPCILFLQELLACQKDFTNYFSQLSGCGLDLREQVRSSYHQLIRMLVEAVQGFSELNDKVLLPALSCVQTCLLHLLDMSWEVQDLPLFEDIKLPDLLLTMSQENISVHDIAISQWTEEDEIADYERNTEWMDECMDGMFEKWFNKIAQASADDKRKMHMFIARYCDLLNVEISCDGCERIAPGHRYRCLQCTDMDLCKTCFLSGAKPEGHEDEHEMVNMEYACDHCQGLIVGSRINCNVCEDFDLCFGCYNAKKYPDSHLPTHRITVYPMVTIRISDRHRLIQPYIHNYSWLLFASLALFTSELMSESTDTVAQGHAAALQSRCSQLITECLMKGQTGKGLRASALLSLLSPNEPEPCPPSPERSQELSISDTSSLPGSTAALCSPPSSLYKTLSADDALDSPSLSSEGTLSPELRAADSSGDTITSPTSEHLATNKEQEDRMPKGPLQEQVFAECSRERILGLLAAMLPPAKPGTTISLSGLSPILPLLFRVVISNAGCLNEAYHLTLGLLGQLLLRISPAEADAAVTEALSEKYELLAPANGAINETEGWKTTQLLFGLGAVCLDSRIGLDWASTVADILRNLNACPQWSEVTASYTDHCIQQLPHQLKRTNIFTLHVLVIFPEVLCMGTQSVFIDNANEQHNIILLKHFTEKNRAAIIDVKTRKRRTVKDYQLMQADESLALSSHYLKNLISIVSQLLQTGMESSSPDAVEATWVLSLTLKGLYSILKHGSEQAQQAMHSAGLMHLLVRKCSKGTGFSKTWLLRDLEILSIMLYSSKREIHSMAEESESGEREEDRESDKEHDSDLSSCGAEDVDPLEGLDEETKACFQLTHDALNAPLHILRALYELQMKRTDSFFREVQKRFDGDVIKTDETIRTLAQKWQPAKRVHSDERHAKAVDTDMIIIPCTLKPSRCETATEETNAVTQKLITITESELQLSYAKQRRTKSSALLHKELDARSNKAVRHYLFRVNEAISILYARHVLALLLAHWPDSSPVREEDLELSGASHMAHILDMLMQLEEKPLWEKILQKVIKGCSRSMLDSLSLTACQFMEEPVMAMQVRESKHPYDNNTNFEDKVHIPGAFYLSVKFDSRCQTEEGCDELQLASSADFQQDLHTFSGSYHKWADVEIPGDTLHYRFVSDMSNTEWGYKFTVTGGHRGRFQTGFEILKQMLADDQALGHLPLADIWEWQVGVACRQTGSQRLKAIHLLLRILQCPTQWGCDLTLLRPLWQLFTTMEGGVNQDPTCITVLLPLHRALTELFFIAETKALEQGILQEYLLALTTNEQLITRTTQVRRPSSPQVCIIKCVNLLYRKCYNMNATLYVLCCFLKKKKKTSLY